jgi:hypothetical protein
MARSGDIKLPPKLTHEKSVSKYRKLSAALIMFFSKAGSDGDVNSMLILGGFKCVLN